MNKWLDKPRYWDNPDWYKKRNKELVKDKKNSMSIATMCGKYGVTPAVIYHIVKNSERKQNGTR